MAAGGAGAVDDDAVKPSNEGNLPQIEVVRVKRLDPDAPKLRFQLRHGVIDLTKGFSLGGSEGIGATWKMPTTGETIKPQTIAQRRLQHQWQAA